jgi:hypothetical protein
MTGQRTTAEQRAALRERYTPEPEPRCPVCGGAMANDDDFGNILPERETWWRCPIHPGQRDQTFPPHDGDPDIVALLDDADALAGALAEVARLRRALGDVGGSIAFVADCLDGEDYSKAARMLAKVGEMVSAALTSQSGASAETVRNLARAALNAESSEGER